MEASENQTAHSNGPWSRPPRPGPTGPPVAAPASPAPAHLSDGAKQTLSRPLRPRTTWRTSSSTFGSNSTKILWACLFLRRRGRRGRCARSRLSPAQPVRVRAARCRRRGHLQGQHLLWDDLMVGMDQGRQRGRARARPRPRTGARGLPLHSQRGPARPPPAPPTNARSLHFKRCGARRRRNRIQRASFDEL